MRLDEPIPIDEAEAAYLWTVPCERLVGARYPVVGVSAARAVSGQELRDLHFAVDRDDGSAGSVSRAAAERPAAIRRLFRIWPRNGATRQASMSRSRSFLQSEQMRNARRCCGSTQPRQSARSLLERCATADASRQQRLQSAHPAICLRPARSPDPSEGSEGCLLEMKHRSEPVPLPTGETRTFLEDGDEVILRGYCQRPDLPRIGFGECVGRILPG